MRKILLGLITGIFVLPVLCESYVSSIEAQVNKTYSEVGTGHGKHLRQTDSVSVHYDPHTSTILITTAAERKTVKIHIYKGWRLIYEDKDDVMKISSLGYTLTDDEKGEYDVYVTLEGGDIIEGTIVKE